MLCSPSGARAGKRTRTAPPMTTMAGRTNMSAPARKALRDKAQQQARWGRVMAVLCYALSAASRRRQRTQQREPRASDAGVAADIDGGSSDTLNADHDARLHKGATGGVYYDNNRSIRDNKAAGGPG